ncbi:helix-turn-helix domain-containing protein [Sphingomonadaceae bacterium OTU29MARTA1]|nr:helix-turn-helix domain-containing protein [Sphingomonadaceae bacterium OTU29MARTA1]
MAIENEAINQVDVILLSVNDAAAALGTSRPTLYKMLNSGALRAVRMGGRTMIPAQALRDYVASLAAFVPETFGEEDKDAPPVVAAEPASSRKLRFKAVLEMTGLSRRQLFERRNAGAFPQGVALSRGVLGWDKEDVEAWIADPAAYRI